MSTLRTHAAIAARKPLEVMEVNLEGPRPGELLIEIKAAGLFIQMSLPAILGHEGAGVVEKLAKGSRASNFVIT